MRDSRDPDSATELTPTSRLFTYHIFGEPRELRAWTADPTSYLLRITGLVRRPLELSIHDVRERFDPVELTTVLQCVTGVHWGRVALKGASLVRLLGAAEPEGWARKVAVHGGDGFTGDLALAEVLAGPQDFLLAYEMNGEPLAAEHGFPVRLASVGRYGYKWCKWVTKLELTDKDFRGHYERRRGWSDRGMRGEPFA